MAYNTKPDAEYVRKFAERMKTQWGQQSTVDEIELGLENLKNEISIASNDPKAPLQPIHTALAGLLVDEDAALITVFPFAHVNPPTDKEKDSQQASELLEPWLAAALKRSQGFDKVWGRMPRTMVSLGRAWTFVSHDPDAWYGDEEYERIDKEDSSAVEAYKRDRWPLRWRHVDTRNTWTYFGGRHWLPEVVECRKLTKEEIEDAYPGQVPDEYAKSRESTPVEVIEYANWEWCCTVIAGKKTANLVWEWKHNLGKNPYVLMEANLMPENDLGIRWKPAMFYATDLIQAFDTILSDLNQNHHENTRAILLQVYDRELYEEDAKTAGRPKVEKWEPGGTYAVWDSEKPMLAPTVEINQQSLFLLQFLHGLIRENAIRPVERGETKSGDSNNKFTTQVQVAEREFDPAMQAINEAWEQICILHFRAVCALNHDYPDKPDKVAIFGQFMSREGTTVKKLIAVGPDDVKGWEAALQAVSSRAIPIDRNSQIAAATALTGLEVPISMIQEELGYESSTAVRRVYYREQLERIVFEQVITPAMVQQATAVFAGLTPEQQGEVEQMFTGATPTVQQVLGESGAVPGNLLQAMANERRNGVPQAPQNPELNQVLPR
jgi:hypothetical protein